MNEGAGKKALIAKAGRGAASRDLRLYLGQPRLELALEHDPSRMGPICNIPFARLHAEVGPGPERAYFSNCIARLTLTRLRSFPAWIAEGLSDDRPIPGDFLLPDGSPTYDEDEEFAQLSIDWAPNKEIHEHSHIIEPKLGRHGKTGVPHIDRLLATIVALQQAIQQAEDFAGFDSCGALEPRLLDAIQRRKVQQLTGYSDDAWNELPKRVWLFERADLEHGLAKQGPRPLTLWGRTAFLHQRAKDRCEKLLFYAKDKVQLPEIRWLASRHSVPCEWDDGEIARLATLAAELRSSGERLRRLLSRDFDQKDLDKCSPASQELVAALRNGPQTAKQLAVSLGLSPTDATTISKRVQRARDQGVPIERTRDGYRLGHVNLTSTTAG